MRAARAAVTLQLRLLVADPTYLMPLATVPMFAIIFLAIVRESGRPDLEQYALLAPVLIAVWSLALFVSGEVVATDRWLGLLEPTTATPASVSLLVFARIATVTLVSLVAVPEVLLAGRLLFDASLTVHHPFVLAATLAATSFAVAGTAVIMAALFVLTRSAGTFQNSLGYPFYVLGGVLVPVALLPGWLHPASTVVFLSWSADLLRASLAEPPVDRLALRLAVICGLGAVGLLVGSALLERILRRLRRDGTIGLA